MEVPPSKFLREQLFPQSKLLKRVVKEGSGALISSNGTIRVDIKVFSSVDGTRIQSSPQSLYRITENQLENQNNDLSSIQQAIVSMRTGEEAWVMIPIGLHQEELNAWEDLWYQIKVLSIEKTVFNLPEDWKFIREHQCGPQKVLKKRVICEGYGDCPKVNNLVTYYYTVFTRNGVECEKYTNKSHVLPKLPTPDTHLGIYFTLQTMREGEECLVLLPPGYFRVKNAEFLWVNIQLLYINECENILYPQNEPFFREEDLGQGVLKRVLKEGQGEVLENIAKVWIEVEGWLEDSYHFQKFKPQVVTFRKESKTCGIAQALLLKTMRKGEVSFIRCPAGTHLYEDTLEKETLWIKYTLVEYLEDIIDLIALKTVEEKLGYAEVLIEIANRLFRSGIRTESKSIYNRINSGLALKKSVLEEISEENKKKYQAIRLRAISNLALVHLKDSEEFKDKDLVDKNTKKTIEFCDLELEISNNSQKAWYRKGKAYFIRGEYEKSKESLEKALENSQKCNEAKELLKEVISKMQNENDREKNVFRGIFTRENWEREAREDEERQRRIDENYNILDEKDQEEEAKQWLDQLQTRGLRLNGIDAVNLLLS